MRGWIRILVDSMVQAAFVRVYTGLNEFSPIHVESVDPSYACGYYIRCASIGSQYLARYESLEQCAGSDGAGGVPTDCTP